MDIDDFDLDRSTAQAWAAFTDTLADVLSVMDDGATLTIGSASADEQIAPFLRYGCPRLGTLVAEASADASLGLAFQLTEEQEAALSALGWISPGPDSQDYHGQWSQDHTAELAEVSVATLRDVFRVQHPVFLTSDNIDGLLRPEAPEEPLPDRRGERLPYPPESLVATMPVDAADLDGLVARELEALLGYPAFRDSEGDFAIRVGSTMMFVRTTPDAREVIAFAVVVHDVTGRSRAAEVLNDVNAESRFVRFWLLRDKVFGSMSCLAQPLVPAHLHQVFKEVAHVADAVDDHLAAALQGRTTFASNS